MPLELHRENVKGLYRASQRCGVPMTQLLNLIVAVALEDLDHVPDLCDEPAVRDTQGASDERGIYPRRSLRHAGDDWLGGDEIDG